MCKTGEIAHEDGLSPSSRVGANAGGCSTGCSRRDYSTNRDLCSTSNDVGAYRVGSSRSSINVQFGMVFEIGFGSGGTTVSAAKICSPWFLRMFEGADAVSHATGSDTVMNIKVREAPKPGTTQRYRAVYMEETCNCVRRTVERLKC